MTDTFTSLAQISLTGLNTPTLLYSNATGGKVIVKHIRVVNQNTNLVTVPTGTANVSTGICMWLSTSLPLITNTDKLVLPTADLSDGGWAEFEGTIILDNGENLYAAKRNSTAATHSDIAVSLYGLEMT